MKIENIVTRKVVPHGRVLERLGVDLRKVDLSHSLSQKYYERLREGPDYDKSSDDWGITWKRPRKGGLYFDVAESPLDTPGLTTSEIDDLGTPVLPTEEEIRLLRSTAEKYRKRGLAVVLDGTWGGLMGWASRVRGHQRFFLDTFSRPRLVAAGLLVTLAVVALGTLTPVIASSLLPTWTLSMLPLPQVRLTSLARICLAETCSLESSAAVESHCG